MVPHSRTITTPPFFARSSNQKIAQDSQEKVNQGRKSVVETQEALVETQEALVETQKALVETQKALAESKGHLDDIEKTYEALALWDPRRYFKLQDIQNAKQDIRDAENRVRDAKEDIRDAENRVRNAENAAKGFERQVERCIEWTDDDTCRKATDFLMNRGIFEQKRQRFKTIQNVVTCDVVERFEDIVDGAGYKGSD